MSRVWGSICSGFMLPGLFRFRVRFSIHHPAHTASRMRVGRHTVVGYLEIPSTPAHSPTRKHSLPFHVSAGYFKVEISNLKFAN